MSLNLKPLNEIFQRLKELHKVAYSPYSNYPVGSIIYVKDKDQYFEGVNVENGAYPLGVCAERSAISLVALHGIYKVDAVFVLGSSKGKDVFSTPCGGCRQVLGEFASNPDMPIYIFNEFGDYKIVKMIELLPFPWDNPLLENK